MVQTNTISKESPSQKKCFIVFENRTITSQEGECAARYSPCSTFKIPLALMGFESGFLKDKDHPVIHYDSSYDALLPVKVRAWEAAHTPSLWMITSCVWYSQVMTQELGFEALNDLVEKLNYGNKDLSGDIGKNNGLTNSWLSSSLKISPLEQVQLLSKLAHFELPFSRRAQELTHGILFQGLLPQGWKYYGKTGSGRQLDAMGGKIPEAPQAWYVGWIEKGERKIIFASYAQDNQPWEGELPFPQSLERDTLKRLESFVTAN